MVRLKFLSHFVDAVHSSSGWSSDDIGVVLPVLAKSESNFNSSTTSSLETTMHRKLVAPYIPEQAGNSMEERTGHEQRRRLRLVGMLGHWQTTGRMMAERDVQSCADMYVHSFLSVTMNNLLKFSTL